MRRAAEVKRKAKEMLFQVSNRAGKKKGKGKAGKREGAGTVTSSKWIQ
jgi:hypothetical protein